MCGLVSWWLIPPIRSKSSADGGTGLGLAAGTGADWELPNRSVTAGEGPELEGSGGFPEKALQSPNSPFPLDDVAARHKITLVCIITSQTLYLTCIWKGWEYLPFEVGRLAEAAGEEKSAKPPMRSELSPA